MSKLTKAAASVTAFAIMFSAMSAAAERIEIAGSRFDFQPGPDERILTVDTDDRSTNRYGASQHSSYYSNSVSPYNPAPDAPLGEEGLNFVHHAEFQNDDTGSETESGGDGSTVAMQSGSRYTNILFPEDFIGIVPGLTVDGTVAELEFDWRSWIIGTGGTMDMYFIGPGGVKYFGLRSAYHKSDSTNPWNSTVDFLDGGEKREHPLTDIRMSGDMEWYRAALADDVWYRVNVIIDFETQRILKAEFRPYDTSNTSFSEEPAAVLKDMPFIERQSNEADLGIGAMRLEAIRAGNGGNIGINWNIDNLAAYSVIDEYYRMTLTAHENDEKPVPEATVKLSGGDFTSSYKTDVNGQIMTKLEPGRYQYEISKLGYETVSGEFDVKAEAENGTSVNITPINYTPEPASIIISGGQNSITAPREQLSYTAKPYSVSVKDQLGIAISEDKYSVRWSVSPEDENVSINAETGEITVRKGFDGSDARIRKFTVTPTVIMGEKVYQNDTACTEISDYRFYDSGVNGSSYADPINPPRAHQIGGGGCYITTSAGGDMENDDGRGYTGIINLPEPIKFVPNSEYTLSFDTAVTSAEVFTFGRSLILCGVKEEEIPDAEDTGEAGESGGEEETENAGDTGEKQTVLTDVDLVSLDYIGMGVGKRKDQAWSSTDSNELETTYGTFAGFDEWKRAEITFTTDSAGVTNAKIKMSGETDEYDLGEMGADNLSKIKVAIARCVSVTDRFAAFKNFVIDGSVPVTFNVPEEFRNTEALLIYARYGGGGELLDAHAEKINLGADEQCTVSTAGKPLGTKVMLWSENNCKPIDTARTVE